MDSPYQQITIPDVAVDTWMSVQNITFYGHDNKEYLSMNSTSNPSEYVAVLDKKNSNHHKIKSAVAFLTDPPVVLRRSELIMTYNPISIRFLHRLLSQLFRGNIRVDTRFLSTHFRFETDLHPLDLYEMGYFSEKQALRDYTSIPQNMFLGLNIIATSPYGLPLHFDTAEAVYSRRFFSCSIVMHTLLSHFSFEEGMFTRMVKKVIQTMPFRSDDVVRQCNADWDLQWEFTYTTQDLPPDWSPFTFLEAFSRVLDFFPTYRVFSDFVMDLDIREGQTPPLLGEKRRRCADDHLHIHS